MLTITTENRWLSMASDLVASFAGAVASSTPEVSSSAFASNGLVEGLNEHHLANMAVPSLPPQVATHI